MRFFLLDEMPVSKPGSWKPPRDLASHLKALRLEADEAFLLLSSDACRVAHWTGKTLEIGDISPRPTTSMRALTLATAWPKGSRADELVARAAEAGVAVLQPLRCERSISGREPIADGKAQRYARRMREVCQQCRNPREPLLKKVPLTPLQLIEANPDSLALLLQPGAPPLLDVLAHELPTSDGHVRDILLLVGPEGGFSSEEETQLLTAGAVAVGLLPTVLRIEAAGPLAAALCQHDRT